MGRSRSPPRKKDRRRSRSRERENEKKLDKFGRDVTSRGDRYNKSSRDDSRRRDERTSTRNYGRDYMNASEDEYRQKERPDTSTYSRYNNSTTHNDPDYTNNHVSTDINRHPYQQSSEYEQRQAMKQMFQEKEEEVDEETRKMQQLMGIATFDSSKGKKHANVSGFSKVNKPARYRQYMNRRGGFNRPLDYVG